MTKRKKTVFWILTILAAGCGMGNWFSLTGILLFATAIMIAPIEKWQSLLNSWFKTKFLKSIVAIALAFLAIAISGNTEVSLPTIEETTTSIQQEVTSDIPQDEATEELPTIERQETSEEVVNPNNEEFVASVPEALAITTESKDKTSSSAKKPNQSTHETETSSDIAIPDGSYFEITYLDVGQADAALVKCDGHYMLIDGGNKGDSNLIYSVLKRSNISHLDIVVGTHAHEDHIGGLPGAFNYATADVTLCPVTSYDSDAFEDFLKYANQKGNGITVPSVGDQYSLGSATVTILGLNASNDTNNTSVVLRIQYGATSFLFTGDAERAAEQVLLSSGYDLSSTVLKVGHHGSDTSTTYPFLREIMPQYAIISVGKGNSYGHPSDDTLSRFRDADVTVLRTDLNGDIVVTSDGSSVSVSSSKQVSVNESAPPSKPEEATLPIAIPDENTGTGGSQPVGTEYIINTNTGKFHYPSCSSVTRMKDSNKMFYTGLRDDLVNQGYSPCGNCHP